MLKNNALFNALYSNNSHPKVNDIKRILSQDPTLARHKNYEGELPLHYSIIRQYNLDIILAIIEAYPRAVKKHSVDGRSALELALTCPIYSNCCTTFAHILSIIKIYPQQIMNPCSDGNSVLFCAIQCLDAIDSIDVIKAIIDYYPEIVRIKSSVSNIYPLQWACFCRSTMAAKELFLLYPDAAKETYNEVDYDYMDTIYPLYPLHYICSLDNDLIDSKTLIKVISSYPDACNVFDGFGDLPLHLYCKICPRPCSSIIKSLLYHNPASASELSFANHRSYRVRVYPLHMLIYHVCVSSIEYNHDILKCVQYLVAKNPSAIDQPEFLENSAVYPVHFLVNSVDKKYTTILARYLCNVSESLKNPPLIDYNATPYYSHRHLAQLNWEARSGVICVVLAVAQAVARDMSIRLSNVENV